MVDLRKLGGFKGLAAVIVLILVGVVAILVLTRTKAPPPHEPAKAVVTGLSADVAPAGLSSRVDYQRLGDRIARLMLEPDMVGLAVGTVEQGRVRFIRGYGETLANSGNPVTSDTVFR